MRKKQLRWRISRIRGSKAEQLGVVPAADEKAAIRAAIEAYRIASPDQQQRLIARLEE